MSIVTRQGDGGETGLLYGGRVAKDDPRTEAYGTVDEAVSALGIARSMSDGGRAAEILVLQRELFTVGAELATDSKYRSQLERHFQPVSPAMVERLDAAIADLEARVALPRGFVVPGGTPAAAALDLARTIIRRAERRAVSLQRSGLLTNPELVRYLNRCSDYLFMLARDAEGDALIEK